MRKFGLIAAMLVAGLMVSQAMGAATIYLSTSPLPAVGQPGPLPSNPQITLEVGQTATLNVWAQLATATSTVLGLNFAETNGAVINVDSVNVWNGAVGSYTDPETGEWAYDYWRWNGADTTTGAVGGFSAVGKFDDRDSGGVAAVGLSSTYASTDPTKRTPTPNKFWVGSFTFTATQAGETDIFLEVNHLLILGNAGFIGTPAAPVLLLGANDTTPVATSVDDKGVNYIAEFARSLLPDAHITVTPEPASLALLALGGLALLRRR